MHHHAIARRFSLLLVVFLLVASPLRALTFDVTFDSSVASDSPVRTLFSQAAADWERLFTNDVTVKILVKSSALGTGTAASTLSSWRLEDYNSLRSRLISNADPYESSLLSDLPDFTTFQTNAHIPEDWDRSSSITKCRFQQALALALGYNRNATWSPYDMTITFTNADSFWDFDPADPVNTGQVDFISTVKHEIGHGLGFVSAVDDVDYYLSQSVPTTIYPSVLDFFRTAAGDVDTLGFTDAPRLLLSGNATAEDGLTYPDQVLYTTAGEILLSTGRYLGDGWQASHFKNQFINPKQYRGIMTPVADLSTPFVYKQISTNDLLALGLLGWNIDGWSTDTTSSWIGLGAGGANARWENDDNWFPYATPSLNTDAYVNLTESGYVEIDYYYAYARNLTINSTAADPSGVRLTGTGALTAQNVFIGDTDSGLFLQTSNTVQINGSLYLAMNPGSSGTYSLTNYLLTVVGDEYIGVAGTGLIDSRRHHEVGGTVYVGLDGPGTFHLDYTSGDSYLRAAGLVVGSGSASGTLEIGSASTLVTLTDRFILGPNAHLSLVSGSKIHLTGAHFQLQSSTPSNLADLDKLELICDGDGSTTQTFELAGADLGRTNTGFLQNFSLATLTLDQTSVVQLLDAYDSGNRSGSGGADESLYVDTLNLAAGTTLDLAGLHLYAHHLNDEGATFLNGLPISLLAGDADGNWKVDGSDLAIWQSNYDPTGTHAGTNAFTLGDFNEDSRIDGQDLAIWQSNYNPLGYLSVLPAATGEDFLQSLQADDLVVYLEACELAGLPPGELATALPEPASLLLLAAGTLLTLRTRRRRAA